MAHGDTTTTGTTDWALLYEREQRDKDYGIYNSFDGVSAEYVDNPQTLAEKINENDLETIILFPSANNCVSALHSCVVAPGKSKVMGVLGTNRHAPINEVTLASSVRKILLPQTRSSATVMIPSLRDFLSCSSREEFAALEGSGDKPISELNLSPQSMWVHPHVLTTYVPKRKAKAADVWELIFLAIEDMEDEDASVLAGQYHKLLVFLWSIEQGFMSAATSSDPADNPKSDITIAGIEAKIRGETLAPSPTKDTKYRGRKGTSGGYPRDDGSVSPGGVGRRGRPNTRDDGSERERSRSDSDPRGLVRRDIGRNDSDVGSRRRKSRSRSRSLSRDRDRRRGDRRRARYRSRSRSRSRSPGRLGRC
jgi:hypothetical protein